MSDAAEIGPVESPRDEQMLGELAELDLAFARLIYNEARAAGSPEGVADLGRAYRGIARSLRQTLALRDRIRRDRRSDPVAASAAPPVPRPDPPKAPPQAPPSAAPLRPAYTERERPDWRVDLPDSDPEPPFVVPPDCAPERKLGSGPEKKPLGSSRDPSPEPALAASPRPLAKPPFRSSA